jgi:hypothetical protein
MHRDSDRSAADLQFAAYCVKLAVGSMVWILKLFYLTMNSSRASSSRIKITNRSLKLQN